MRSAAKNLPRPSSRRWPNVSGRTQPATAVPAKPQTRGGHLAHAATNAVLAAGLAGLAWWRISAFGDTSAGVGIALLVAVFFTAGLATRLVRAYYAPAMSDDDDDDQALIAEVRGGSEPAFNMLVDRHQQAVRMFLRRLLGSEADADDIAQETFLAAWTHARSFRAEANVRTWLCGIAWRKAKAAQRSWFRRRARDARLPRPCRPPAPGAQ